MKGESLLVRNRLFITTLIEGIHLEAIPQRDNDVLFLRKFLKEKCLIIGKLLWYKEDICPRTCSLSKIINNKIV